MQGAALPVAPSGRGQRVFERRGGLPRGVRVAFDPERSVGEERSVPVDAAEVARGHRPQHLIAAAARSDEARLGGAPCESRSRANRWKPATGECSARAPCSHWAASVSRCRAVRPSRRGRAARIRRRELEPHGDPLGVVGWAVAPMTGGTPRAHRHGEQTQRRQEPTARPPPARGACRLSVGGTVPSQGCCWNIEDRDFRRFGGVEWQQKRRRT